MSERITSQKQIILDYLRETKVHPTAEEVYLNVKKKLPRISLGTVYRNLEHFVDTGKILEINGEPRRFDGDLIDHQHFVCNTCNKIYDIFYKFPSIKNFKKQKNNIGKIENHQILFYGICKKCNK